MSAAMPNAVCVNGSGAGQTTDPAAGAIANISCAPATASSGWSVGADGISGGPAPAASGGSVGSDGRDGVPPKSPWKTMPRLPSGSTRGIEPIPGIGSKTENAPPPAGELVQLESLPQSRSQ